MGKKAAMPIDYEALASKTKAKTLRLLDREEVYNHLYNVSAKFAFNKSDAEEKLDGLWRMLYDIEYESLRAKDAEGNCTIEQLKELAAKYLSNSFLHSRYIRNSLILALLNSAFPKPKRFNIPENYVLPLLFIALPLVWLVPLVNQLFTYAFGAALLFYLFRFIFNYRVDQLVDNLESEILSGHFNDEIVKEKLKKLNDLRHQLPSIIFDLIDQRPRKYSESESSDFVKSLPVEQWQAGMKIKREWQTRL